MTLNSARGQTRPGIVPRCCHSAKPALVNLCEISRFSRFDYRAALPASLRSRNHGQANKQASLASVTYYFLVLIKVESFGNQISCTMDRTKKCW